ncbi:hypothetical protein F5X97DRAFT_329079 [Nemania serpens]|nr:hypothetical protein F5X97DRAFT_329079 [Nemania serpens]
MPSLAPSTAPSSQPLAPTSGSEPDIDSSLQEQSQTGSSSSIPTGAGVNTGAGTTREKTEAEIEADRLYEEAMEEEYAKREGVRPFEVASVGDRFLQISRRRIAGKVTYMIFTHHCTVASGIFDVRASYWLGAAVLPFNLTGRFCFYSKTIPKGASMLAWRRTKRGYIQPVVRQSDRSSQQPTNPADKRAAGMFPSTNAVNRQEAGIVSRLELKADAQT